MSLSIVYTRAQLGIHAPSVTVGSFIERAPQTLNRRATRSGC